MHLRSMPCVVCGAKEGKIIYRENFKPEDLNDRVFSARRLPDRIHYQIQRCEHDGMVWSSPVLSPEDAARLYAKSSFSYSTEVGNLTATYLSALKEPLAELLPDAKILEVGCGSGFILEALYAQGFREVYGVEPSHDAVSKSAPQIRSKITVDMFREGLFQAESFDMIFFFQTLDHIYDPNNFLAECSRLLRPGGFVVAFQHDASSWSARLLGERSPIIDVEHIYLFNPKTVKLLFEKHGFLVNKVFSPKNLVSLRHLLWLSPIPRAIKQIFLRFQVSWLSWALKIPLGNLCLIGQKEKRI